jgi:hypothetical protein
MGRLSVVAHEASDVKGKDKRTNAYLKFFTVFVRFHVPHRRRAERNVEADEDGEERDY